MFLAKSFLNQHKKWIIFTISALLLMGILSACATSKAEQPKTELLISAAVSLQESLEEIKALYEQSHNEISLRFNFGASGALRQQIEQGGPADLFLSADKKNMDLLISGKQVDTANASAFTNNDLVVVVPANSSSTPTQVSDLLQDSYRQVAVGDPLTVPAGTYAQEALTSLKHWEDLQKKAVFGKNVKQVLTYVETDNADVGFVYKTDALSSDKVKIAFTVEPSSHGPIQYYAGVVSDTEHMEQAQSFYKFLKEPEAQNILQKHGFAAIE